MVYSGAVLCCDAQWCSDALLRCAMLWFAMVEYFAEKCNGSVQWCYVVVFNCNGAMLYYGLQWCSAML